MKLEFPEYSGPIHVFSAIASLLLIISLSACAKPTYWVKPGATSAEWEQVKAACLLEGVREVPVATTYSLHPGSSYTTTNCDKKGQNCSTYETQTPPSYEQHDANAPLRDQVVRGCYARNGWTEQVVR